MQVKQVSISQLISDPNNARKHDDKNINSIKGSLAKFGQQHPIIIDKNNLILAGNGRVEAMKQMGWDSVSCVQSTLETITEKTAFALADNRTSELAAWDDDVLKDSLQGLIADEFDLDAIGFDDSDLDDLLPKLPGEGNTDDDAVPEVDDNPYNVQLGDVWQLGEHRLMCGDSTDKATVDKLMNGEKADMVFTDPPYGGNVGGLKPYTGEQRKERQSKGQRLVYQDRTLKNDKTIEWLIDCFPILPVKENSTKLVFFKWDAFVKILEYAECWGKPSACLVWDRVKKASAFFRFQPQHEFIFHWGNQSDKRQKSSLSNVFSIPKDEADIHPTVKPIALLQPIIDVCCSSGELILDPFLGSGSTLIACEKTNRKCYGMELDPHYCSVIIQRWQDFTGKEANKL